MGAGDADRPGQPTFVQSLPKVRAAAEPGISQYAAEVQLGLDQPVDLGQRDLRLGLRRPRRLRHARRRTAVRIVGPAGRQKQPQPDRHRHFAARQRQRDQHLAVRRLAQLAAVLRRHADRSRALLGVARVIDHQHGIRAADLPVGLLGEHPPQWPCAA